MSKLMAALAVALLCVSVAQAQDKKPAAEAQMSAQQSKMSDCNKTANKKEFSGEERKKFMSDCLKRGPEDALAATGKPVDQKQKMAYCNHEAGAKQLKGDDRKKFMSDCLKG
jgi:uncharacterized protein HemX